MANKKKKSGKGKLGGGIGSVLVIILAIIFLWMNPEYIPFGNDDIDEPVTPVEGEIQVHVIDVGQGDAILITTPAGNMLIDAGTNSSEKALQTYLNDHGIKEIEYVVFTHPHEDHIGGADMVMRNYKVKNVILPDAESTSKTYTNMLTAIEESDANVIEAVSGAKYALGDLAFRLLAPNSEKYSNTNDYSVVIRATYGTVSMMFTGDAEGNFEGESEKEILKKYSAAELQSDFLKMGHHGSTTSSSPAFMAAVNPKICAISVGEGNTYGHPHRETIQMLEESKIPYYRTDLNGSLVFVCDGETIQYKK